MKMILWTILGAFIFLIGLLAWSAYPWSINEKVLMVDVVHVEPETMVDVEEHPSVVKILTWNLGFLYGQGSEGPGYEHREIDFYKRNLEQLAKEILEAQADIVCLQEIDFESSRSHDINQAQYIAIKAGYPYVAEAVSWDANYIPFPYWPLTNNFGRMKSGGAVLSKYPILDNNVHLLSKPASQPWWYNLFYLHRYFQKVTVELGDKKFSIVNLHLEAFDKVDRNEQTKKLVSRVLSEKIDFVAGDFNMVPPSATKRSKFFNADDYENDPTYETLLKSNLLEVIPDDIYAKAESQYFTFPAWAPDRRLDYIWYKPELKMMKAEVLPSALSDHLPLRASFQIDSPRFNPYSQ